MSYPQELGRDVDSMLDLFPIPRWISDIVLIFHNSPKGTMAFVGVSGTLSRQLVAVAFVMIAYKSIKGRFVVMGLSTRVSVYPFVEFGF
jgi:hypothetical protein